MIARIRRSFVFALALSSLCLSVVRAERPNIVVFLVDDMGVMDTSVPFLTDAEGSPKRYPLNDYYRTPNMERLATRGVRFNNFYAMSVCSPTRISIMTGQNAARHHATNWINPDKNNAGPFGPPDWNWRGLNKQTVTLPRILEGEGYRKSGTILSVAGVPVPDFTRLALGLVLDSDATVADDGSIVGDPTEAALVVLAAKLGVDAEETRGPLTPADADTMLDELRSAPRPDRLWR